MHVLVCACVRVRVSSSEYFKQVLASAQESLRAMLRMDTWEVRALSHALSDRHSVLTLP